MIEEETNKTDQVNESPKEQGEESVFSESTSDFLLDRLLYKGVLPRYAFPTDVATFYVFDQDNCTAVRPVFKFSPSQGLAIALTQYAPGKEVWIAGKVYISGAIYSPMRKELSEMWQKRKLYAECSVCGYAKTFNYDQNMRNVRIDCEACGNKGTVGPTRVWLRPPGFAHPVDVDEKTSLEDQPDRSYATRAKLDNPTPSEHENWIILNDRLKVFGMREHLLVTNSGPKKEGYSLCTLCNRIEATVQHKSQVLTPHRTPYPDQNTCLGGKTAKSVVLGTDFITDILLISMKVASPMTLKPGITSTHVVLRTLSEAIGKAACNKLELESGEIMSEYRPSLTANGWSGLEAEIFLYDTLPGGAGFSSNLDRLGISLFEDALDILENCPENCEKSCYRCLRSYKNKFEHSLLDRQLGAHLLRYLLTGDMQSFSEKRLQLAADLLANDLNRQAGDSLVIKRNETITIPGFEVIIVPILIVKEDGDQFLVDVTNPLMPNYPSNKKLSDLMEFSTSPVLVIDELTIRNHLSSATLNILKKTGIG
jgi:hypothetical protein